MGNFRAGSGAWALALLLGLPAPAQEPAKKPPTDVERVLARLNEHRKIAGLDPVVEDKELSKGCQLHATYLALNHDRPETEDSGAHQEDKKLPGFSEAGDKSAKKSCISPSMNSNRAEDRVDSLMATFYHRPPLMGIWLDRVGIGCSAIGTSGKVVVIEPAWRDATSEPRVYPALYPAPDQVEVPLVFALGREEWPDPRPNKSEKAGYPITVICDQLSWQPGEATASLTAQGKEVPAWVFSRENPAIKERPVHEVICILPKQPLRPKTKYTATVRCKKYGVERTPEWSQTWSFTTGADDGTRAEIRKEK